MNYPHLSLNKRAAFTSVELMIAAAIFLSLIAVAFQYTVSSLQVQASESRGIELQQNVRSALQLIAQDIRSSTGLHVINKNNCNTGETCSNNNQISVISANGDITLVRENPGQAYINSTSTRVCDARSFTSGSTAILMNVTDVQSGNISYDYLDITGRSISANHNAPCTRINSDRIFHNSISGTWNNKSYISQAIVATYSLGPDPIDTNKLVLYRRTGLSTTGEKTGIVAFGISDLKISYGISLNANFGGTSKLTFYPSLEAAHAAIGNTYSALPDSNLPYLGNFIGAIRITLTGTSRKILATTGKHSEFSLSQTVELRR